MNGVFDYIFKSLEHSEVVMTKSVKVLKNHDKALRWMSLAVFAMSAQNVLRSMHDSERDKKIRELEKEIQELKMKEE